MAKVRTSMAGPNCDTISTTYTLPDPLLSCQRRGPARSCPHCGPQRFVGRPATSARCDQRLIQVTFPPGLHSAQGMLCSRGER
jgi:hypothetical protein